MNEQPTEFLRAVAVLSAVVCAFSAEAQTRTSSAPPSILPTARHETVRKIEIVLGKGCTSLPNVIHVVIDDVDDDEVPVQRRASRTWTPDDNVPAFDAEESHVSVRFETGRTDCRRYAELVTDRSHPDEDRIARYEFTCTNKPVSTVQVLPSPGAATVSYVRELAKTAHPRSSDCREHAVLDSSRTINAVQFPDEKLRLQFGLKQPDPEAPGLYVTGDTELSRTGVIAMLIEQRAGVTTRLVPAQRAEAATSPPRRLVAERRPEVTTTAAQNFSSTAIDVDWKALESAHLERIEVKVK